MGSVLQIFAATVSAFVLLHHALEDWRRIALPVAGVVLGLTLVVVLPTTATRFAGFVLGLAVAVVAEKLYDARRPKRSRTRR